MTDLTKLSHVDLLKLALSQATQLEAMRKDAAAKISFKVSEKGALSIYGLGRWPITLYKSQFDALFSDENIARARAFRQANDALFATKE